MQIRSRRICQVFMFCIIAFLGIHRSTAQLIRLSEQPDAFITDFKVVMATGNNTYAVALSEKFEKQWQSSFSPQQKELFIALSLEMSKKGHKMPQYYLVLRLLDHATNAMAYSEKDITHLLDVLKKTVIANPLKKVNDNLEAINEFVRSRVLYTSNYNRLYALNGDFSFDFIENERPYFETKTTEKVISKKEIAVEDFGLFDDWDKESTDSDWYENTSIEETEALNRTIELPLAGDLVMNLKNVDVVMVTASDSVVIKKTTGAVLWQSGKFLGNEGNVTWESVGMPQISVALKQYFFDIRNPRFSAENVVLSYPERLTAAIDGVFEFRGTKRPKGVMASYPRFKSYESKAVIKNIEQNISYKGGFSMMGNQILSSSLSDRFSTIIVEKKGEYHFKAIGRKFVLSDSLISSDRVSFVAYMDGDSITHPAVKFQYNSNQKWVRLNKVNSTGFKDSPYADTYHQMNIRCDAVRWNLATQKMDFYIVSGKGVIPAVFESFNFYNPERVRELSGAAGFNPLLLVGNFVKKTKKTSFTVQEIAQSVGRPAEQFSGGLMATVQQGLLNYNPADNLYSLAEKGKHFLKAFAGQTDYDDLVVPSFFNTTDSTSNGSFDLKAKNLTIRGTKIFSLSDSLGIYFIPYDETIQIKKNRTFSFNGQLKVKNYRFAGKNLEIDYDNFIVKLNKIDSISFVPQAVYRKGGRREIGSHIKFEQSGMLYLNRPDNKAGKQYLPEYPRLVMDKGVVVYFDEDSRKNKKYNREVYFDIPEIDYDSLNVKDLEFEGTFYSGDIFKPFKEKLVVMPDTTIGFAHTPPKGMYNVYGGNSAIKFASNLTMDGKGLRTSGEINHLAASLTAKNIFFATDSLVASGELGEIRETDYANDVYFPKVDIRDYTLRWKPKVDSMIIATKKGFNFYAGTSSLTGKLVVREGGLFGLGILARNDSDTESDQFKFNKKGFNANESIFKIKSSVTKTKPVLLGQNVNVNFNVLDNLVNIAINEASFNDTTRSSLEFPYAAYRTNIGQATWSIEDKKITMQGNVENSTFTSTNAEQAGLAFNGSSALYDIVGMTLNIEGVPSITTADAFVIPKEGKVAIRRDAEMLPFKNARLTIDTLNGYHNLIDGNIRILSRKAFSGDATYQFVNVSKDTFNIKMGNFELKNLLGTTKTRVATESLSTVAKANVMVSDSVFLSPKILYKGEIAMLAPQKNLSLNGFVIPELKKYPQLGGNWITYKGDKSEEITITVDEKLRSNDIPIFAGLHLRANAGTNGLYPTFLSPKSNVEDENIFLTKGTFRRDEPRKLFSIYPENSTSKEGNRYEFIDDAGIIRTEGSYNLLGGKIAKFIKTAGTAEVRLDSSLYNFDAMMVYDFPLPMPLTLNMSEKIIKNNLDAGGVPPAVLFEDENFLSKLSQFVGDKAAEDYKNKLFREHIPMFKFSPKFAATMVFSDLKLRWNPDVNSFHSVGKLGISNIGESDINAQVEGYLEIIKNPAAGDEIYLFLELSGENWYYLGFKNGELGVISSDDAFNNLITAKEKGGKKSKEYEVIPVDFAEPIAFRKRFLMTYRNVKEEQFTKKIANQKKLAETPKPEEKKEEKKKTDEKDGF